MKPADYGGFIVDADNVCFKYTVHSEDDGAEGKELEIDALRGVSLAVDKGAFIAVLGHNGSGKSTFAKLCNALLVPSSGRLLVAGLDTAVEANIWLVRQTAGMVFQNPDNQIIATLVEEDVAFGPENLGVAPGEIRTRVDAALEAVGMTDYAGQSPHFLSGGQKQRVAIAGILAMKPDVIVLDEPTAMLDPIGRREVLTYLSRLNKESGITIILITHYMDEAVSADRVVVMENGAVALDGPPKAVFANAAELRRLGLDVPQVTEIGRRLADLGFDVPRDALDINELVDAICPLI